LEFVQPRLIYLWFLKVKNMSNKKLRTFLIIGSFFVVAAIVLSTLFYFKVERKLANCPNIAKQFQLAIKNELPVGANAESMKNFMTRHGIIFSFDQISNRYQGSFGNVDNPPGVECGVTVYIYVDQNGNYLKSDIRPVYTFL